MIDYRSNVRSRSTTIAVSRIFFLISKVHTLCSLLNAISYSCRHPLIQAPLRHTILAVYGLGGFVMSAESAVAWASNITGKELHLPRNNPHPSVGG